MLQRSGLKHFYLTLPSNSSAHMFGIQPPGEYRTTLTREVSISPADWEVGLSEIIYPRTWANVRDAELILHIPAPSVSMPHVDGGLLKYEVTRRKKLVCPIPTARYKSPEHLIHIMNAIIVMALGKENHKEGIKLIYHEMSGKALVVCDANFILEMNASASIPLGYGEALRTLLKTDGENGALNEKSVITGDHAKTVISNLFIFSTLVVDPNRALSTLYVYTDVVEPQLVGDAYVPLVRTVVDRNEGGGGRGERGETVSRAFTNVHYVNASRGKIHDVQVHITDDAGKRVPFEAGRVVVKLHFRRKKA